MRLLGEAFDTLTAQFTALPHIANPREKAALVLDIAGDYSREDLVTMRDEPLDAETIARLENVLASAKAGTPLAYALGEWYFAGRLFFITPDVLIPRSDTETLLLVVLRHSVMLPCGLGILEIGVGSGAVIVSLACELAAKEPHCIGTDVSTAALEVAAGNVEAHECDVELREGSIFKPIERDERFDIIVSNPPYIEPSETVEDSVRDYEPQLAYRVPEGMPGTHYHKLIAEGAQAHIAEGGMLAMEVGANQAQEVTLIMRALGYTEVSITKDLAGIGRVVSGIWRKL
jgi:release factor glutamine methyltransferase